MSTRCTPHLCQSLCILELLMLRPYSPITLEGKHSCPRSPLEIEMALYNQRAAVVPVTWLTVSRACLGDSTTLAHTYLSKYWQRAEWLFEGLRFAWLSSFLLFDSSLLHAVSSHARLCKKKTSRVDDLRLSECLSPSWNFRLWCQRKISIEQLPVPAS